MLLQRALQYYARLNALQYTRYTMLLEPLPALAYSQRTCFTTCAHSLAEEKLTDFLTRTQEQMQTYIICL